MGGKILEYEAKTILKQGISLGRTRGFNTGKLEAYISLIHDGLLTIPEAAKRLEMDEKELKEYMRSFDAV